MRNSMKWWKKLKENLPKKKQKKKVNQKKSSFDELLALQKQQIEIQREQSEHYEKIMRQTLEEQRKMDKVERERDREFFLELGKVFSGSKQHTHFFQKTY